MKLQCGICGENHCPMDCNIIRVVSHIPDKPIPSKARQTLPDDLEIKKLADESSTVIALYTIEKGTQFGPLQAKKNSTLLPTIYFPLKLFCISEEEFLEYFLDTSDENECSWMMFVAAASDFQEQNLICYQDGEDLYYVAIRDILEGEHLKVWYSPHYAIKMQKDLLKPIQRENMEEPENHPVALTKNQNPVATRNTWSCKFCGKVEKNISEFAKHLLKHYHVLSGRYCHICNTSFLKKQGFQKHMKIVHESNVPTNILITSETSRKENEPQQLESIGKSSTKVPKVSKDVYVGGPLLNEVVADSLDISTLDLPQSENIAFDLNSIENQGLFENENLNLNMESILEDDHKGLEHFNFELKETETEQFICDICLKTFKKLKNLIFHMDLHTGKHTCRVCYKVFARKENLSFHPCKSYFMVKCDLCGKLFHQRKYLNNHMKSVHKSSFDCQRCKRSFSSKLDLLDHPCPIKKSDPVFSCDICSKKFRYRKNYVSHMRSHELPKEMHPCLVCNITLSSRRSYGNHMKLHQGSSHQCDECQKVFSRLDTMLYHKKVAHGVSKEICKICGKEVKSKKLLHSHMMTHQNDRTFKCSECSKTYKQSRNLLRHIKSSHRMNNKGIQRAIAEIDKPFSCPKCGKKMKSSYSLKRHLASFHPDHHMSHEHIKRQRGKSKIASVLKKEEQAVLDLKQTIENMDFNTDDINPFNAEINIEIDKFLNNPEIFTNDSKDRLLESLMISNVKDDNKTDLKEQEVFLSMPELDLDQDTNLGKLPGTEISKNTTDSMIHFLDQQ